MDNENVFAMSFAKVYPMLIAKAERKSRTREDVLEVTAWLTGYTHGADLGCGQLLREPVRSVSRRLKTGEPHLAPCFYCSSISFIALAFLV